MNLDLLDGRSTALHVSDTRLVRSILIRTAPSAVGNICKLGDTGVVIKAVGAFSSFDDFVVLAGGGVVGLGCFWVPRRRFLQI